MKTTEFEKKVCPDCNGSGVYQEYDEYDRYTVHFCATCDGSGEIARQTVTDEAVQRAIEQVENIKEYLLSEAQSEQHTQVTTDDDMALDLAITALQAYQPTTLKDRTVDEVAISKTETTSCPNADQHRRSK